MSGCCEKKIIYVGVSAGKNKYLLDRLIEHFCAMSALNKNIIERVCEKAHENIYYYMNPYLWHPDVEVVVITLEGIQEKKVSEIEKILSNIAKKIDEKLQNRGIKENDLKETLEKIIKKEALEKIIKTLECEKAKKVLEIKEILNNIAEKIEEKLRNGRIKENDLKEALEKIIKETLEKALKIDAIKKKDIKEGDEVEELEKKEEELRIEELRQTIKKIKKIIEKSGNKIGKETIEEIMKEIEELKLNSKLNSIVKDAFNLPLKLELTDILEKILISILNPELNKSKGDILEEVRQLALQSSISEDLKSYLCNYGLKIREIACLKELLKNLKGFYVIKHKMLPEEFEDTERAKRFREFTMDIFCEFLKKKERKA